MEETVSLPQEVLSNLKQCLHSLKFENYTLECSKGSDKGQNYLGIITKVKVKGTDEKGNPKTAYLIVKSAPRSQEFRDYVKIDILHEREVYMYERVLVEISKFQEEVGVDVIYTFPRCYLSSKAAPYENLIFEDMNYLGYVLKNRKTTIDLDHSLAVLKAYGRFHALGLALKFKKPHIYKDLSDNTKETYFNNVNLSNLSDTIKGPINKIIKNLNETNDAQLIHKLQNFIKFPQEGLLENLSMEATSGVAVFCHSDCWINNMLFKYEEDNSRPSKVCLLDWQLGRCSSPAIDVSYFIFACTDKALRDAHYPALLDAYHSSFVECLAASGVDPGVFSKETFRQHMRKFSKYGLMMCLIAVPLFAADLDEIPDWTGHMEEGEREKMFLMERKSEGHIVDKLTGIARDFDELKYI